jgi:hypothetical protein
MTPLTTAAAATRVIRSPPGSQLERNRAFWRMISASFMQVSDAHLHRRNRRRSASVARSSATPPLARRASSSSSSDTADAAAAADGDYELEERSAGNTPRRRSATGSRAISPAAPRKHTPRKSKSPASPSSSRASKQGDSDDSSGELSSALCLSDSNREQLATPAGKQAGSKRKRASSSWHCNIKPAPSISILNRNRMSLCLLRTLLPRVMTATEARRGLILLPIKCSCSGTRLQSGIIPGMIPDLPGIGGLSPPPSPICRGSGVHPRRHPRFAGDRGSSPSPVPIGGSVPCLRVCLH